MDKETLLAPPHVFRFLVHPLEIVHLPFEPAAAVYTAALGNDEFDVHYRGVMSWLSLLSNRLFFFYAEYPPELDRLGSLFSPFFSKRRSPLSQSTQKVIQNRTSSSTGVFDFLR